MSQFSMHNVFLSKNGIKVFGNQLHKEMLLDINVISYPYEIKMNNTNIRNIITGYLRTFFIMKDGTVKGIGNNTYGQLGIGNNINQETLVDIPITNVKNIYCTNYSTIFLLNNGTVKACGRNVQNHLGSGGDVYKLIDIPINNVKEISCGNYYVLYLLNDGTVKGMGQNNNGQLGIGNTVTQTSLVTIPINNVKEISCGDSHTLFLLNDGTVKGCGFNSIGQLGINDTSFYPKTPTTINISNVSAIRCFQYSSFFIMSDGTVKGCGQNNNMGQLGIPNSNNNVVNITTIPNISNVKDIIVNNCYSFFILNDNTIKGCGLNEKGQLGTGDITNKKSIVDIPNLQDLLIFNNDKLKIYDSNINLKDNIIATTFNMSIEDTNLGSRIYQKLYKNDTDEILQQKEITIEANPEGNIHLNYI